MAQEQGQGGSGEAAGPAGGAAACSVSSSGAAAHAPPSPAAPAAAAEAQARDPAALARAWQQEYLDSLPAQARLLSAAPPPAPLRILRSAQLDALRLDAELGAMLREQLGRALALFAPGRVAAFEPELNALLSLLIFRLSVWAGRATPGSELMNLRYRDEGAMAAAARRASHAAAGPSGRVDGGGAAAPSWLRGGRSGVEGPGLSRRQVALFGVGYVLLPYLWQRAHRALAARSDEWGGLAGGGNGDPFAAVDGSGRGAAAEGEEQQQRGFWTRRRAAAAWRALRWLEGAYKVGVAANLVVFLHRGVYRTPLERALGARLVYRRADASRVVSFEYLNRQLVWQELSDFLLFLLPLVNVSRVKRAVMTVFPRLPVLMPGGDAGAGAHAGWTVAARQGLGAGWGGGGARGAAAAGAAAAGGKQQQGKGAGQQGAAATQAAADAAGALFTAAGKAEDLRGGGWFGLSDASEAEGGGQQAAAAAAAGAASGEQQQVGAGSSPADAGGGGGAGDDAAAEEEFDAPGPCPICGLREIVVPYVALPCRHVFCYYCLRSHTEADTAFECPVDGARVGALQRYAWRREA